MAKIYDDQTEENLHRYAIESLAAELHYPVSEVRRIYEEEFVRLKTGARIKDFLVVFATRGARASLLRAHA
jgi:hypothetical protein